MEASTSAKVVSIDENARRTQLARYENDRCESGMLRWGLRFAKQSRPPRHSASPAGRGLESPEPSLTGTRRGPPRSLEKPPFRTRDVAWVLLVKRLQSDVPDLAGPVRLEGVAGRVPSNFDGRHL